METMALVKALQDATKILTDASIRVADEWGTHFNEVSYRLTHAKQHIQKEDLFALAFRPQS